MGSGRPDQYVIDADGHENAFVLGSELGRQPITFKDVTIQGTNGGAAIDTSEIEPLTLDEVILRANRNLAYAPDTGTGGAGLAIRSGVVSILHSTIEDNMADKFGGGIAMTGGELTVRDSELRNNMTADYGMGGAISLTNASKLTIQRSRLDHNGSWTGGAIATLGHQELLDVSDSTFDANTALSRGGAIDVAYDPYNNVSVDTSATVMSSTFVDNEGPQGSALGGVLSHLALRNSVLARNFPGNCVGALTPIVSLGHNVADDVTCALHGTGDRQAIDPRIGAVDVNGGPTASAMPMAGSPLLDAADRSFCSATDQRGVARPQGAGCDIGAVERAPDAHVTEPVVTTTPATTTPPPPAAGSPLVLSRVDLPSVVRSATAIVTWQATTPGSVRFAIQHRSGGHWITNARFTLSAKAGDNSHAVPRTALRHLPPGRYRLAADPTGPGAATYTRFRYAPRRPPAP
jgi:hypothetical protein